MTSTNSDQITSFIDAEYCKDCHGGGTNFQESFKAAFQILEESMNRGATSTCARAIMFLTDGVADFYDDDYTYVEEQAKALQVAMLTYAIGDDADETVLKRVACENR